MKILIVGDIHGNEAILPRLDFCAAQHKCDIIFQLGDFGFFPTDGVLFPVQYKMEIPLYWIDGNHEHFDLLETYDKDSYIARTNCTHIPRGTVLQWDSFNVLCIGGASSIDKKFRVEGYSWFKQENLTDEDIERCFNHPHHIDVVLAHETFERGVPKSSVFWDPPGIRNRERLQQIRDRWPQSIWINGHWHVLTEMRRNHIVLNDPAIQNLVLIFDTSKPEDPISYTPLPEI